MENIIENLKPYCANPYSFNKEFSLFNYDNPLGSLDGEEFIRIEKERRKIEKFLKEDLKEIIENRKDLLCYFIY